MEEYFHTADAVHGELPFKLMDGAAFSAVNSSAIDILILTLQFSLSFARSHRARSRYRVSQLKTAPLSLDKPYLHDSRVSKIEPGSGSFLRSELPPPPRSAPNSENGALSTSIEDFRVDVNVL